MCTRSGSGRAARGMGSDAIVKRMKGVGEVVGQQQCQIVGQVFEDRARRRGRQPLIDLQPLPYGFPVDGPSRPGELGSHTGAVGRAAHLPADGGKAGDLGADGIGARNGEERPQTGGQAP